MRRKIFTILFLLSFYTVHAERYLSLPNAGMQNTNFNEVKIGDPYIIRWAYSTVGWYLNQNGAGDGLTFQQTYNAVQTAFNSWDAISTSSISFAYQGSTTRNWANDGYNVVYWAEVGDDIYSLTSQRNNMALTYITSDVNQNIVDVDIIFTGLNTDPWGNPFYWRIDGAYADIQAVATHEVGHMIGIAHTDVTSNPLPTMYQSYNGLDERSLELDDKAGASFLYGGNIITDQTLIYSPRYFKWSINVNSGATLTITDKTVQFGTSVSLAINGGLNATNSTFTSMSSTWGGIQFNYGSSGILDWSVIKNVQTNGGAAIVINGSSPTIQNCTVENNTSITYGIYVMNNAAPYLNNNIVRNNSYDAIVFDHAGGYLTNNQITASNGRASINCWDTANPSFTSPSGGNGRNLIQNGAYGIYADWYSTPNAGISSSQSSNNKFLDATAFNAIATGNSTVYAKYNYWSPFPPMRIGADAGSVVYWDPNLTTPPFSIQKPDDLIEHVSLSKVVVSTNENDDLLSAADLKSKKKYNEAISIYQQILDKDESEYLSSTALVELNHIYRETKNRELFTYIKGFATKNKVTKGIALDLIVNILLDESQIEEARTMNDELLGSNFKKTRFAMKGNLNLFNIYYKQGKYSLANDVLSDLKSKYEQNIGINTAEWLMRSVGEKPIELNKQIKKINNELITTNFSIDQNYPNPFNPTTKISFSVPQRSQIKLKVFDVLGREVATLAEGVYEAGKYEVTFDASSANGGLPSGVYFYNLTTASGSVSKKMLLIK